MANECNILFVCGLKVLDSVNIFAGKLSLTNFFQFIFSVNKISSLADFEECPNLQELYLRKNCIEDINDLVYLQVTAYL